MGNVISKFVKKYAITNSSNEKVKVSKIVANIVGAQIGTKTMACSSPGRWCLSGARWFYPCTAIGQGSASASCAAVAAEAAIAAEAEATQTAVSYPS